MTQPTVTDRKKWNDGNGTLLSLKDLLRMKMVVKATTRSERLVR